MPDDPVIRELRDEISANDHAIVAALNRRIDLVGRLRRHKEAHGIAFVDPERERRMHEDLAASIAKNILTTEAIVAEPPEKTPAGAGAGMPDMGGMM